jgi:hypothetical protein
MRTGNTWSPDVGLAAEDLPSDGALITRLREVYHVSAFPVPF